MQTGCYVLGTFNACGDKQGRLTIRLETAEARSKCLEEGRRRKEEDAKYNSEKSEPDLDIRTKKDAVVASNDTEIPSLVFTFPESHKRRPPLDLSSTHKPIPQPLPSALSTARHIQDVYQVQYPEGINSPKPELNTNAKDGKFLLESYTRSAKH